MLWQSIRGIIFLVVVWLVFCTCAAYVKKHLWGVITGLYLWRWLASAWRFCVSWLPRLH